MENNRIRDIIGDYGAPFMSLSYAQIFYMYILPRVPKKYKSLKSNCLVTTEEKLVKLVLLVRQDFNLTLKALGFFLPVQHWGGGLFSTPLCKIRSRHSRKLKFTGLIAYVMF